MKTFTAIFLGLAAFTARAQTNSIPTGTNTIPALTNSIASTNKPRAAFHYPAPPTPLQQIEMVKKQKAALKTLLDKFLTEQRAAHHENALRQQAKQITVQQQNQQDDAIRREFAAKNGPVGQKLAELELKEIEIRKRYGISQP